jgi:hypothetical protein
MIMFHASEFLSQDNGVTEMNVLTQVYAMYGYGWFLLMIKLDVPVVITDLVLNVTPSLYKVDLPILTMDAVYPVFKPRSSLIGQKKMLAFLSGRSTVLMLCLDNTPLTQLKVGPTKGKKATNVRTSLGG